MKVIYKERLFIDCYKCIDKKKELNAISFFNPEGTGLYYFKINEYNYKTIAIEDIISIN